MAIKYFHWNRRLMKLIGHYPIIKQWGLIPRTLYICWRYFVVFVLYVVTSLLLLGMVKNDNFNIIDSAMDIINFLLYVSGILRCSIYLYNIDRVEKLLNEMEEIFVEKYDGVLEKLSMVKGNRDARIVFYSWTGFIMMAVVFVLAALIVGTESGLIFYTFDYDLSIPLYYYGTLVAQVFGYTMMAFSFIELEMWNACAMVLLAAQLNLLNGKFRDLFYKTLLESGGNLDDVKYLEEKPTEWNERMEERLTAIMRSSHFEENLLTNLKHCINHHQHLITYVKDYQGVFSILLFIEAFFNFMYFILILFVVITSDDKQLIMSLSQYALGCCVQIFMMTFFGEAVKTELENLCITLYNLPWYRCKARILKDFKFVFTRVHDDFTIKAGNIMPMSMATFMEFIKKVFSFLAVLRQMT